MFDFITYMQALAESHKELSHSAANKCFFRVSGIAQMEELLQNLSVAKFPALIVEDMPEGRYIDAVSDNVIDRRYFSFYVLHTAKIEDADDRSGAIAYCKEIVNSLISKMFRDFKNANVDFSDASGLRTLERNSISYRAVGPVGDNCVGIWVSFTVIDKTGVVYKETDWNSVS